MQQIASKWFSFGSVRSDLLILALTCILLSILGSVPFYHPDFVVKKALLAIQNGGHPQSFNYPGLIIYLNSIVYGGVFAGMYLLKLVRSPEEFAQLYERRTLISSPVEVSFFLPGHVITLCFSVLGVIGVYLIVYKLIHTRIFALSAGLLLATSFLWVANAHYVTVDIPLGALAVITVLLTIQIVQSGSNPSMKQISGLGVLIGLTTSAKYNGAVVGLAAVGGLWMAYGDHKRWWRHLVVLSLAALAAFVVTNPFMILDFRGFRRDLVFELAHARNGHPGFTTDRAWWFHLTTTLSTAYGWLPLVLALGGLGWVVGTSSLQPASKLAIILFPLTYYAMMGSSKLAFQRYMVPMLPFIAVFAALALSALAGYIRSMWTGRQLYWPVMALFAATIAMTLANVQHVIAHNLLLTQRDTRAVLQALIENARLEQPGVNVLAGRFAGRYFSETSQIASFEAMQMQRTNVVTFDSFSRQIPVLARTVEQHSHMLDILIFDSFSHDELIYDHQVRLQLAPSLFLAPTVIQISPFTLPKEQVPFSPESMYSPYLPDLQYRHSPGPFIELYVHDSATVKAILGACEHIQGQCVALPNTNGYYYRHLAARH